MPCGSLSRSTARAAMAIVVLVGYPLAAQAPQPLPGRAWQVAVTAGFNSVAAAKQSLLADNRGSELGFLVTTPWRLWNESYSAFGVRAQAVAYPNAIDTPSPTVAGESVKLTNAVHSQVRADFRQIYEIWGIHWSLGLGLMLPVTNSISTPRGEFSYADARTAYPQAADSVRKIDRSFAVFARLGIDQKLLDDYLLVGLGLDISALEFPRTQQLVSINLYAGVRVW